MKVKFRKNNKYKYGQDFDFFIGIPHGIEFDVSKINNKKVRLIADGYGNLKCVGTYGNGALYTSIKNLPKKLQNELPPTAAKRN